MVEVVEPHLVRFEARGVRFGVELRREGFVDGGG